MRASLQLYATSPELQRVRVAALFQSRCASTRRIYKVPDLPLVLLLALYPCALRAQTTKASITGRVTDPSKATIAEAKVAAINTSTNFRYETATNGAEDYTLANLPPVAEHVPLDMLGHKTFAWSIAVDRVRGGV